MPNLFARAASTLAGEAPESAGCGCPVVADGARLRRRARRNRSRRRDAPSRQAAAGSLRVYAGLRVGRPRRARPGQFWRPVRSRYRRHDARRRVPLVGVSGVGVSPREAFQGCIGEGVEYLSQLQTADDILQPAGPGDPASELGPQSQALVAAFSAHRLRDDAELAWCWSDGGWPAGDGSCCRRTCACGGRPANVRSSRRFR